MKIQETYENATEERIFGESPWYEPYTNNLGRLFRSMQQEYGRCVGPVYTEWARGGPDTRSGWIFEKKMEYEGYRGRGDRYYIRQVWVSIRFENDEVNPWGGPVIKTEEDEE